MKKIVIKYFIDFIDGQENWLNKMANHGWKLTKTSKLLYEFEKCNPREYEYKIEFVAHMCNSERKKYINFIETFGYNLFIKNINLNYSIGKIRWRPWALGSGQISTSSGNYNKELLIIERKKENKPFELHTDLDDLIKYTKSIRNAHLYSTILLLGIIIFSCSSNIDNRFSIIIFIIVSILVLVLFTKTLKYSKMLYNYKKQSKLYD